MWYNKDVNSTLRKNVFLRPHLKPLETLQKRGKLNIDVIVLERGEIGGQASSAAAGLLAPLGPLSGPGPFADLVLAGFSCLSSLVPELEDISGIRMGYEQTGALRMIRNPKRIINLQKRLKSWQPLGLQLYWLSGEEARQREPLLIMDP